MKKIILLPLCILFISCFKEPKKEVNSIIPREQTQLTKTKEEPPKIDSTNIPALNEKLVEEEQKEVQINGMSLKTLEAILKMEKNEFVDWCVENQYVYDELKYYEYFNVLYYKKPNISYIGFSISKSELSKPSVLFNTNDGTEYDKILKECNSSDYNFSKTKASNTDNSRVIFEIYTNASNEVSFYLSDKIDSFKYNIAIKKL